MKALNKVQTYVPWYVIAWRALWLIPYSISIMLVCLCVLCMYGPREARSLWDWLR